MTFDKLSNILNDDILVTRISSISNQLDAAPKVLTRLYSLIHDDSVFWNVTNDSQKRGLAYMAVTVYDGCFYAYNENIIKPDHCKYGAIEVYDIDAADGLRPATIGEVKSGVHGLIAKNIYPAGEESYRNISIILWLFTDIAYYYRCAGLPIEYDRFGKVSTTTYEMLNRAVKRIADAITWLMQGNAEKAIKIINKYKSSGGYKYAEYAKDEVRENISIKQLIKNIDNEMPRNSDKAEFRRAISLIIKTNKNNVRLTPLEISWLRNVYDELIATKSNTEKPEMDTRLKADCDRISQAQLAGLLSRSDFVFKIIGTLSKNGYTKCSPKQRKFIDDAIEKLDNINRENNTGNKSPAQVINDDDIDLTLTGVSDLIGQGLFE